MLGKERLDSRERDRDRERFKRDSRERERERESERERERQGCVERTFLSRVNIIELTKERD